MKSKLKAGKAAVWLGGTALVLLATVFGSCHFRNENYKDQVLSALLDARQMDMITSPEEAAALSPAIPVTRNAAPIYRDLVKAPSANSSPSKLISERDKDPSAETRRAIQTHLREDAEFIALSEQAAVKPDCWFNRDYEKGYAMLFPELQPMMRAVQNFCLRAMIAYQDRRLGAALSDLKRARQVTLHMDSELADIGILAALAGRTILVRTLAPMTAGSPQEAGFRNLLSSIVKENKPKSIREIFRFALLNDLLMLEQTTTKEGREKHGYGDMQLKPGFLFLSLVAGDSEGQYLVIDGHMKRWTLAGEGAVGNDPAIRAAEQQIARGMMSNPYSGEAYSQIMGTDGEMLEWSLVEKLELSRLSMAVVERIVSSRGDPLKVKIDDLQPRSGTKLAVWSAGGKINIGPETLKESGEQGQFALPLAH